MGFGCSCDVYLHWRHREIGIAWVRGRTRQVTMALRCAAVRRDCVKRCSTRCSVLPDTLY